MTPSDFRATFPEFADASAYPDTQVAFYIALGGKLHAADRWGDLLDYGVSLFVAHELTLGAEAARQAKAKQTPGQVRGAVTSMSADGVSWSREGVSSVSDPSNGHWNLSTYGLRWKEMANLVGAGPVYVGAPTALELQLSDWPWPGLT